MLLEQNAPKLGQRLRADIVERPEGALAILGERDDRFWPGGLLGRAEPQARPFPAFLNRKWFLDGPAVRHGILTTLHRLTFVYVVSGKPPKGLALGFVPLGTRTSLHTTCVAGS